MQHVCLSHIWLESTTDWKAETAFMHFVKLATPSGIGKRLEQSRPCPWGFWTWRREVEKGKPMGHHVEAKDLGKRQQRRNRGTAGDFGRVWKRRRTKPVVSKRWTRRSKERKDNCTGDVSGMGNCWRNYHSVPNRVLGLEEDCWVALKKLFLLLACVCLPLGKQQGQYLYNAYMLDTSPLSREQVMSGSSLPL